MRTISLIAKKKRKFISSITLCNWKFTPKPNEEAKRQIKGRIKCRCCCVCWKWWNGNKLLHSQRECFRKQKKKKMPTYFPIKFCWFLISFSNKHFMAQFLWKFPNNFWRPFNHYICSSKKFHIFCSSSTSFSSWIRPKKLEKIFPSQNGNETTKLDWGWIEEKKKNWIFEFVVFQIVQTIVFRSTHIPLLLLFCYSVRSHFSLCD